MRKKMSWLKNENLLTAGLLLTAVILIAAGVAMKQNHQVLAKAVRICLECIGIG